MPTGCPKCDDIQIKKGDRTSLCLEHELEFEDDQVKYHMRNIERIKKEMEKKSEHSKHQRITDC